MKENKVISGTSILSNINEKTYSYLLNIEKRAQVLVNNHYKKIGTSYNNLILDNLLSNGKCHLVALFKEYLIIDDISEFFRRFYNKYESSSRLKKITKYYYETSVIFPNYTPLFESKFIYRNIMRKQKIIDQIQEIEDQRIKDKKLIKKLKNKNIIENIINDTTYNEILNQSESVLRIVFGLKKKDLNYFEQTEENDNEEIEIQNLIDKITKYENKITITSTTKNKIKLSIPNLKNKPKLSIIQTVNFKSIIDYRNKSNILYTESLNSHSPNSTNYNTISNSTSRYLKANISVLNTNSNKQTNHKPTLSMPKINPMSSVKEKKIKLLSYNTIDINNNSIYKHFIDFKKNYKNNKEIKSVNKNLFSILPTKKTHKKMRSVLGRNIEGELFRVKIFNTNNNNNNKEKKMFRLKQKEEKKPSLLIQDDFYGFYSARNKK